jgi:glycosyltransferase involved in cell wall biosynthesis
VLVLAYFFPPLGGGGVQRTLKHVKYLPDAGFEPIVLTTRPIWSALWDPSLGDDVPPGTVVIRAPEVPLQVAKWGMHRVLRRAGLPTTITASIGWPDEMAGWLPGAVWHALGAIRRYRPDVLYSTSSPVTAHAVGLIASRLTGIPWIADFRDGWTQNPQGERPAKPLAQLSAILERTVVRHAHFVTVVDESVELLGIGPDDSRWVLIRNGVDPADLAPPEARRPSTRFTISHVGALYGARDAAPVFAALRSLLDKGAIERRKLELRLVGSWPLEEDPNLRQIPVGRIGHVDHSAALSEMAAADVLLFYAPATNRGPSGKIYEYLASGRPILCVAGSDNFAFRIVDELDAGRCAQPGDQPAIEQAIEALYRSWSVGKLGIGPHVRTEALRRFSRPALARELAAVLSAAASNRPLAESSVPPAEGDSRPQPREASTERR